jgi:hypothetical protein
LDDFCSLTMVKPSSFAPMARVIKRASLTPACDEDRWGSPAGIPKPSSPTTTCAHSSKMTDPQSSWFSLALVDQLGKKNLGTGHWCPIFHWHTHNCPYPGGKMSEATATWSSIVFWLVNYPHSCWLVSPFFKRLFQTKVHYIL